ncbi:DUF362 domain-containing protein [Bacteroidota bacterium]
MYNPLPHLPGKFQRIIKLLKRHKIPYAIVFFTIGFLSTLWFLIRVVPKPSRAAYPCMQATAPFMSGFVIYLLSLGAGVLALKHFRTSLLKSKYTLAFLFLIMSGMLFLFSNTQIPLSSKAGISIIQKGNFPPNAPIGEAQGIFPGRVVWIWNPDATNENCDNTSNFNSYIDPGDNAWFQDFNNDQAVIDNMISESLLALTEASSDAEAWDDIFKHYNTVNGNGNTGYTNGEKVFLKINCTTLHGDVGFKYYADLSRNDDITLNAFAAESNPFLILSMLRQLVYKANVPQHLIYIGDPARNIYKSFYELWHIEFPNVNYLGNDLLHPILNLSNLGRVPVAVTQDDKVYWSDNGTAMPDAISDKIFTIFEEMDYLINIPTLKAHSSAGITLAAKNHFGSFTRTWAMHLHSGLLAEDDDPYRLGYGLYRVQTDIMMHNLLSGKNLLMIVDGLYPGEAALGVPEKWTSSPFNNDWCSSVFMSLDPVAIESVCHDFLRTEYNGPTIPESRPNWDGVDDYLHQAADSSLWPNGIVYDPDNDGILIESLGVHEHWNNSTNKQYTRNLGTGYGIELIKIHEIVGLMDNQNKIADIEVYPNPVVNYVMIKNSSDEDLIFVLSDINGKTLLEGKTNPKSQEVLDMKSYSNGVYFLQYILSSEKESLKLIKL